MRQASLTRRRKQRNKSKNKGSGYSNLPPYHPDYQGPESEGEQGAESESASSVDGTNHGGGRVRRGSEGYEFKPVDREEMLKRYLGQIGETPGRYHRYIPQVESESDNEEDNIPLGLRAQTY